MSYCRCLERGAESGYLLVLEEIYQSSRTSGTAPIAPQFADSHFLLLVLTSQERRAPRQLCLVNVGTCALPAARSSLVGE